MRVVVPVRALSLALALGCASWCSRARADDPANTPQPMPPPRDDPGSVEAQDAPYRLRDVLRFEAERGRMARYFDGVVFTLAGIGIVTAGVTSLALTSTSDPDARTARAQAYVMIAGGGVVTVASLVHALVPSSVEKLARSYETDAEDTRVPAERRVYLGEEALRAAARSDMTTRRITGAVTIVAGLGLAVLAVWRSTLTESSKSDRTVSGTLTAASSLVTVGSGVAQIWFLRGPSEVALAHWEASQGRLREGASVPRIAPTLTAGPGAVVAGLILSM